MVKYSNYIFLLNVFDSNIEQVNLSKQFYSLPKCFGAIAPNMTYTFLYFTAIHFHLHLLEIKKNIFEQFLNMHFYCYCTPYIWGYFQYK